MSKSIQLRNKDNEKMYPHPYYPVGSIYLSVNNTNPSKWFGGIWEQIAKGRTLIGVDTSQSEFNTVKKTGGEKTHTLTVDEIPSHNHNVNKDYGLFYHSMSTSQWQLTNNSNGGVQKGSPTSDNTGGGQAHNNLQPYFTCYIWLRTA